MKYSVEEAVRLRHLAVNRESQGFLARNSGSSHEWYADRVKFPRATITKFLLDYAGCRPKSGNRYMKLLEAFEWLFACEHLIREAPLQLPTMSPPDDDYLAAYYLAEAVRALLKNESVFALRMIGQYCSNAEHCAVGYRSSSSVRVANAMHMLVADPSIVPAEHSLFDYTVHRLRRLYAVVMSTSPAAILEENRRNTPHMADAYVGCGLSYCGLYKGEEHLVDEGVELQVRAIPSQPTIEHGYAHNLFKFSDVGMKAGRAYALRVADRAADVARTWRTNPMVHRTMQTHFYPALDQYFFRVHRDVYDQWRAEGLL